jgi:hypothetical protein
VRYDRLRSFAAGFLVPVLIGVALVAVALVGLVAGSALDGGLVGFFTDLSARDIFLAGALLVAAAVSVAPYLYLHYEEADVDLTPWRDGGLASLRPGWVVAGAAVPLAAWWLGPEWLASGAFGLLPLVWVVPMLAARSGATYRLDPASMRLDRTDVDADRTRSDDLGAVVRTRRVDLPFAASALFLLAYRGNAWYRSTPWVVVPDERADDVEAALDDVLARSDGPSRASVPERVVLALVGSFSLVAGLVMAVAAGEGAAGALLALLTAPFSLLFLALAARL